MACMQTLFQKKTNTSTTTTTTTPLLQHKRKQYIRSAHTVLHVYTLRFDKLQEWIAFSRQLECVQESATTAHLSGCHTKKHMACAMHTHGSVLHTVCAYNKIQKHSIDLCTTTLRHITTQHNTTQTTLF